MTSKPPPVALEDDVNAKTTCAVVVVTDVGALLPPAPSAAPVPTHIGAAFHAVPKFMVTDVWLVKLTLNATSWPAMIEPHPVPHVGVPLCAPNAPPPPTETA